MLRMLSPVGFLKALWLIKFGRALPRFEQQQLLNSTPVTLAQCAGDCMLAFSLGEAEASTNLGQ